MHTIKLSITMTDLETILSWFQTGDMPTQEEFQETFSSFRHSNTKIPIAEVDGLESSLNNKANIGDIPDNMALVDEGHSKDVFNKEQIMAMSMMLSDYVKDGKIKADKIEALGLTDLIESSENDISKFVENFGKYEFQQNDFIAIPGADGNFSLYIFKGGEKKDKNNYLATGISNITLGMVDGLQDKLNKKVDTPLEDGRFYIKRESGVNTTEILPDETLASVVRGGNYCPKPIYFVDGDEEYTSLGMNPTTYSFFWGDMKRDHTGLTNIAMGYYSMSNLTVGESNSAYSIGALYKLTSGYKNTAFGQATLYNLTTGYSNSAFGQGGLNNLTIGFKNVSLGTSAGAALTKGNLNTLLGYKANNSVDFGDKNIFIGANSAQGVTGSNNIMIGVGAGVNGGALNNKLIIHSNHTLSGYSNTSEGNFTTPQLSYLDNALVTGDFVEKWVKLNSSLQVSRLPAADALFTKNVIAKPDGTFGLEDKKEYVPLAGTEPTKPLTGNVRIDNSSTYFQHYYTGDVNTGIYNGLTFEGSTGVRLEGQNGNQISRFFASPATAIIQADNGSLSSRIQLTGDAITISGQNFKHITLPNAQGDTTYTRQLVQKDDGSIGYTSLKGNFIRPAYKSLSDEGNTEIDFKDADIIHFNYGYKGSIIFLKMTDFNTNASNGNYQLFANSNNIPLEISNTVRNVAIFYKDGSLSEFGKLFQTTSGTLLGDFRRYMVTYNNYSDRVVFLEF
ncbi:hypothetical protein [Chryseobacterium sp. 18068]|uniref:hypothetical protein n=1 Tax=Chryseobacterium sp. 18068 TaxID=2681414 RepID=UPI0013581163|nr:hypothetical protein [Chryseobacterium sp. 18068]